MILPIVLVTIQGSQPKIQRDVDAGDALWSTECGVFVDVVATLVVDRPELLFLTQEDCSGVGHVVSDEEDELFDLGRGLGADVVGYYIEESVFGALGCAAHPGDRRGFWVADEAEDFDWVWIHELTHVVGDNSHVTNTDNLMYPFADVMTNLPPDLNEDQCQRILNDPALLCVSSVVLNL